MTMTKTVLELCEKRDEHRGTLSVQHRRIASFAPAKAGGFTVELYNGADVLRTEHMGSRDEVLVFLIEIAGKVLTGHAYTDR